MKNEQEEKVIEFFYHSAIQYAQETLPEKHWDVDNGIKAMEIRNQMELNEDRVRFLCQRMTEQGFEIEATIGDKINNLSDLNHAMYDIFSHVVESFLIMQFTVDKTSWKYWLMTGSLAGKSAHGHIGVIKIKREYIEHLDPEFFSRR